jgi:glucose/mannose-6-phosphate isomerase
MEPVAIRWRQQINENSKELSWHHVIPEMNHNELVGWRNQEDDLYVIFLRNENDYERIQQRMDINKGIISKYAKAVEIYSKGVSHVEKALYFIHLGDWISYYIAAEKDIDAVEVKVIDYLKSELAK